MPPPVSSAEIDERPSQLDDTTHQEIRADHLLQLPGKPWAFWKWVCLRGAGFPARAVLSLSAEKCAAATDAVFLSEIQMEEKGRQTVGAFRDALSVATSDEQRKELARAIRQLNKRRVPDSIGGHLESQCSEFSNSLSELELALTHFKQQFQSGVLRISHAIRSITKDSKFRQAMLLQNREAFRRVARSFEHQCDKQLKRGFKERQNEELVASYLQRYCVKNDTIGFFGPVGWAKLEPGERDIQMHAGPSLVSTSSIFFENWCIETVAEKMASDGSLRPWMAPRLLPFFHVEGHQLRGPNGALSGLALSHAALLNKCEGVLMAREIAHEMMISPESAIATEGEVYRLLALFALRGVISWKFEIPICLDPENRLRHLLERIGDKALRRPHLEILDELERGRNNVARAVDDAEQLEQALERLDEAFIRITGKGATKSAGAMYASRTLTYQDCRRDLSLHIGAPIIFALGPPLSLLLTSARWFSYQAAGAYRDAFQQVYEDLSRQNGSSNVDLLPFWGRIEPLIFDPEKRLFNGVVSDFQRRWEEVLGMGSAHGPLERKSHDLRAKVESLFSAPHAGWKLARYHSPDVMIAASSTEAIRRGDYFFVLGEMHITTNTLRFSFAVSQHPQPQELFQAIRSDLARPHVLPVAPKQWPRITNRTAITLFSAQDFHLEVAPDTLANAPRSQALPISSLILTRSPEGLVVKTRDGRLSFDVIEFIGEMLSGAAVEMMKIASRRPHQPRLTIDQLVVCRESWSFLASDLRFIHHKDETERYLQARRWMHENTLPRFVFVRVPVEVKPFYVDFDSPLYVEILVKMVRRMLASNKSHEAITVAEMLPAPDQLWLPDANGGLYASELRMVVRDLADWFPPWHSQVSGFSETVAT